ncbi:MAG: GspH/FimT family pseudopilin [Halieaceae bacterium]|jgi:general secretion pathway protein H|nr:GspH/FimT family pseudopilin [Halieaceae bacterium]
MPTSLINPLAPRLAERGFTLLELMVALLVASLLAVLAMPSAQRMSETMRYREAVRDLVTAARTARRDAFAHGAAYDLLIFEDQPGWALVPAQRASEVLRGDIETQPLPKDLSFDVTYAAEVSPGRGVASIRFYPSGGASGGDVDILRPSGSGVRLKIDWLLGEVVQVPVSSR